MTPFSPKPAPVCFPNPSKICVPLFFASPAPQLPSSESAQSNSASATKGESTEPGSAFPKDVRIGGLNTSGKGGGPAFVGQVFSMCDVSGNGIMAVSNHFDIPFISKRMPQRIKKMFATITKSDKNGPVFRFFMDLGDAVRYVKKLNIPSGGVGACRLDLAYGHFMEKPHLFRFVPNEKQVKAANKLLKKIPQNGGRKRIDGVPVFTAQNLDIAIATTDGIKWYTPYFFDKHTLDSILEQSIDHHFHHLIQSRHVQRRRDVIDDNLAAEVLEDNAESLWEPPEVQEVLDEVGHPGIPLSVISKAAEMQLLYAVDRVLLGNRWLRKATGIQPKFPYMVDSFEKRSAASFRRASPSKRFVASPEMGNDNKDTEELGPSDPKLEDNTQRDQGQNSASWFPVWDLFNHPWSNKRQEPQNRSNARIEDASREHIKQELQLAPFLPKITMVGISAGESGMSKVNLKKTMEDLTKELEQADQENAVGCINSEFEVENRDPLFVANVGSYGSGLVARSPVPSVRGENN